MRKMTFSIAVLVLVTVLLGSSAHATDARPICYMAYSMNEAARRLDQPGGTGKDVATLGRMTRLIGAVYDPERADLILLGVIVPGEPALSLDDFVVALRARLVCGRWPEVSIDKTSETPQTRLQKVRMEGGIEGTQYGKDLVDADVILKKLALAELSGEIWGVRSYLALAADRARQKTTERNLGTRFWFYPRKAPVVVDDGIVFAEDMRVGVRKDVYMSVLAGTEEVDPEKRVNAVADTFAESMTNAFEEIALQYPEVGRVKTLLALAGIAYGVELWKEKPPLDYWLKEFSVTHIDTPSTYPLIVKEAPIEGLGILQVDGGVQLKAYQGTFEEEGDLKPLRDVVIQSRPKTATLVWRVPIDEWSLPGTKSAVVTPNEQQVQLTVPEGKPIGCTVAEQFLPKTLSSRSLLPDFGILPPAYQSASVAFPVTKHLALQTRNSDIGGVTLRGAAKVKGGGNVKVDLGGGDFSLVVDGENARLAPEEFRRFVTALWAVYFSEEDPGISIDPIAPGVDKHLVRYIGQVINSDLGRVMREADYLMKKWAVGTDRPDMAGFADVDTLSSKHGLGLVGAHRRFWFVPEDMTFKQGGDLLLFDGGRMTVKTEYVVQDKQQKAEASDEAFAAFFTEHYSEIAVKYPVYQELFDYAKLVALAKYLKESGVPLFWFLMANKDLVLTEDSPGTVDALAKGSKYFEGITVEGGVDLSVDGNYVYDAAAAKAITGAMARRDAAPGVIGSASSTEPMPALAPSEPFDFKVANHSYSVVPQHSLTCGKDRRGVRYQTDIASRQSGQPTLELVRYFKPGDTAGGEFGQGWHLLIPYRIKPVGRETQEFLTAVIPVKMAVINSLTGEEEVLTFSSDRYSIAGYVPDKLETSQLVGLFLMSDASFRLADKLGNEFWFNGAGFLTDMLFFGKHRVHVEYVESVTERFAKNPYKVQACTEERTSFSNVALPMKMKVSDLIHGDSEILCFSSTGRIAGYVPRDPKRSRYEILAPLTDGSYRLLDKTGNESLFAASGAFAGMTITAEFPMVASISVGEQTLRFTYTIDRLGKATVAKAELSAGKETNALYAVDYRYDSEDRLAAVESSAAGMTASSSGRSGADRAAAAG